MRSPSSWQVSLILVMGVLAVSTSAVFVRLALAAGGTSGVGFSLFLAASRLIIASFLLLPGWRKIPNFQETSTAYYYAIAAGFTLAFHFATWITSLSFTSIAASTTLVTTNPIWVAVLSWLWFKEIPTKKTILGIIIALIGGVFIVIGDGTNSVAASNPFLGNVLALVGALTVSLYFLLGREAQRHGLRVSSYIVIVYTIAALILFPFPLIIGSGYLNYPTSVYFYVLLMAIFPQLIGHTALNWSVRWISPILVTLVILFEPVFASCLGFFLFGEMPTILVLVGAIILLLGVAIAVIGSQKNDQVA
ncbi:DMT family transporter [Crocosphaera sp. XPORK-15E]|uniref:DMT family transporter n=1 Tax=Crocosphaera sp. XPORK-15E TaxID=3110247 RepID=UPI002B217B0B|nr:DMT family transporter [Crocosphaera sp. XPORK-15E]MEA5535971.1 DMT family transporter [Crocosphaera sp. XPORK-15E]